MTIITDIPTTDGVRVSGTLKVHNIVDIGDLCTHCGCDTSPGSGMWVNRIPSGSESADGEWELDGYMCADCQTDTCSVCGKETLEWSMHAHKGIVCDECTEVGSD